MKKYHIIKSLKDNAVLVSTFSTFESAAKAMHEIARDCHSSLTHKWLTGIDVLVYGCLDETYVVTAKDGIYEIFCEDCVD